MGWNFYVVSIVWVGCVSHKIWQLDNLGITYLFQVPTRSSVCCIYGTRTRLPGGGDISGLWTCFVVFFSPRAPRDAVSPMCDCLIWFRCVSLPCLVLYLKCCLPYVPLSGVKRLDVLLVSPACSLFPCIWIFKDSCLWLSLVSAFLAPLCSNRDSKKLLFYALLLKVIFPNSGNNNTVCLHTHKTIMH